MTDPRFPSVEVETPEGSVHTVVEVPETVAVLLFDIPHQQFVLVEQFRAGARTRLLNAVAGYIDPGETPEEAAVRECREEVGLAPNTLDNYGTYFKSPGWNSEVVHLFIGSDLEESPLEGDETGAIVVRLTRGAPYEAMVSDATTALLFHLFKG